MEPFPLIDSLQKLALSSTFILRKGSLESVEESLESQSSVPALGTDSVVDSKYKICGLIGEGGMGAVYKVHHLLLQKDMALKTFRTRNLSSESWQRFQREAQSIAKLKHKNIVEVFDFGVAQTHLPYYTMELLVGESLAERLARTGPIEPGEALQIFLQAAQAIAHAHHHHIVHRDIKPANIFLQKEPRSSSARINVKIVDFGIAKLAEDTAEETTGGKNQNLTQTGTVFGSPLYMSPEQSLGLAVDQRTDIYSFGCALFESLVGYPPFIGESALATILNHQTKTVANLHDVLVDVVLPQRLDRLMDKLLAKTPEKRFQSFENVVSELNYCIEELASKRPKNVVTNARPQVDDEQDLPLPNNNFRTKIIVSCAIAAIVALSCLCLIGQRQPAGPSARTNAVKPQMSAEDIQQIDPESNLQRTDPDKKNRESTSFDTSPFEKKSRGGKRIFVFPNQAIMGSFTDEMYRITQLCRGTVSIPENQHVVFEPSAELFRSPRLFERFGNSLYGLNLKYSIDTEWSSKELQFITKSQALEKLNITAAQIDSTGINYIGQLSHLRELDVSRTPISGRDLTCLKNLNHITSLTAYEVEKMSDLFSFVGKNPSKYRLGSLILTRNNITDDDLAEIGKITTLTDLCLNQNSIHGPGLENLVSLTGLKILRIQNNPLQRNSLRTLAKLTKLKVLFIDKDSFLQPDLDQLKVQLPGCHIYADPKRKAANVGDQLP